MSIIANIWSVSATYQLHSLLYLVTDGIDYTNTEPELKMINYLAGDNMLK